MFPSRVLTSPDVEVAGNVHSGGGGVREASAGASRDKDE